MDNHTINLFHPGAASAMNPHHLPHNQRPKPPLPSYFPSSPTSESAVDNEIRLFSTPSPRLVIHSSHSTSNNSGTNSNNSPDILSPSTTAPFRVIVGGGERVERGGGGGNGVGSPEIEFPEMILLSGGGGAGGGSSSSTTTRTHQLIDAASRSLSHSSSSIGSSVEMTTSSSSSSAATAAKPTNNNSGSSNGIPNDKPAFEQRLTSQLSFSEKAEQYCAAMTASVSVLRAAVTRKQQLDALEDMRATVNSAKGEGQAGR